ncbi:hypothetical protein MHPYR_470037 [uncultured Mycobacterium sp.]|uniref:Uncharacterized protein n=1 Tax=uncultured Mycobacterium sp. TaxID=171292 RepID=A0A1Y5PGD5_9MYCO|nr:hypothetical protein MHPYR_470037 [uncultured Mycobacterium sp.]
METNIHVDSAEIVQAPEFNPVLAKVLDIYNLSAQRRSNHQ